LPELKAMTSHEYGYRMRVGDWRILFDVKDRIKIITIQEVKKRDEHTYQHSDHHAGWEAGVCGYSL
jgi:mRNA-degrading endonuclease RelE of RelBE toxin-antitoxin system